MAIEKGADQAPNRALASLAAEASLYGFPLAFELSEVGRLASRGVGPGVAPAAGRFGLPEPRPGVAEELGFFRSRSLGMQAVPPPAPGLAYQQRFEPPGLLAAESPYLDPDPALAAALRDGIATAR